MQGIQFDEEKFEYIRPNTSMSTIDPNSGFIVKLLGRKTGVTDINNAKIVLLVITSIFSAIAFYTYDGLINEPTRQSNAQQEQDAKLFEGMEFK